MPHEINQPSLPSKHYKKLVAVESQVESVVITGVSRTFDVEYTCLQENELGSEEDGTRCSAPFLVKTKDVPEINIDESRIRGLQGTYHSMNALVEVEKKQTMGGNVDDVGVFGTCPSPLKVLILDGNDLGNVLLNNSTDAKDSNHPSSMSGLASLLHAVSGTPTMKELSLSNNTLNDAGAAIVAKILSHPHNRLSLITLHLNNCNIGDAGYLSLLRMLVVNVQLKNVFLHANMVTAAPATTSTINKDQEELQNMLGGGSSDSGTSIAAAQDNDEKNSLLTRAMCEVMLGLRQSLQGLSGWDLRWVCPQTGVRFTTEERWLQWKHRHDSSSRMEKGLLAKEKELLAQKQFQDNLILAYYKQRMENSIDLPPPPTEEEKHYLYLIKQYIEYGLISNVEQIKHGMTFLTNEGIAFLYNEGEHDLSSYHHFDMTRGLDFEKAIGLTVIDTTKGTTPMEFVTEMTTQMQSEQTKQSESNQTQQDNNGGNQKQLIKEYMGEDEDLVLGDVLYSYWGGCMTENMQKIIVAEELNNEQENDTPQRVLVGHGMVLYDMSSQMSAEKVRKEQEEKEEKEKEEKEKKEQQEKEVKEEVKEESTTDSKEDSKEDNGGINPVEKVSQPPLIHLKTRQALWTNLHLYRAEREHQLLCAYRSKKKKYQPTTVVDIINNKYMLHTVEMEPTRFEEIVGNIDVLALGPEAYVGSNKKIHLE